MSLIKRSEWPSLINGTWLSDFFDNDRFFDSDMLKKQSLPAVNIKETDRDFVIEVAVPGLNKNDFNVTAENGVLTISSEKEEEKESKEKDFTRKEFSYSAFSRSFTLPENAQEEDIKATYQDGILKLNVAKKNVGQAKPRKAIEVK